MEKFLIDNWLTLLSLVIALTGGVPGLLSLIEYLRRRPKLQVTLQNSITGIVADKVGSRRRILVALGLTLANEGDQPLVPAVFDLRMKGKRRDVVFDRFLIPENVSLEGAEQQDIRVEDMASRDLQRHTQPITSAAPVYGWLMFVTDRISLHELIALAPFDFELTCIDVVGKAHRRDIRFEASTLPFPVTYPKLGATISPKKPGP